MKREGEKNIESSSLKKIKMEINNGVRVLTTLVKLLLEQVTGN